MKTPVSSQRGAQTLHQHGALGAGSELWIIPELDRSEWTMKLDWYLNFQISRAKYHESAKMPLALQKIVKDYDISHETPKVPSGLLMIACDGRLPAHFVIKVPESHKHQEWIEKIFNIWSHLLTPNLRIFLPAEFPLNQFSSFWPDKASISKLTLVPSQSTPQN